MSVLYITPHTKSKDMGGMGVNVLSLPLWSRNFQNEKKTRVFVCFLSFARLTYKEKILWPKAQYLSKQHESVQ